MGTRSKKRRSGQPGIRAVARHLWGSPVHAAAVDLLDPWAGERGRVVDLGAADSIDAVVGLNVAHLLGDVGQAAVEVVRVLRANGRVLFVEEDIDDPSHTFHHATPHAPDGPTLDELSAAMTDAGLRVSPPQSRRLGGQPAYSITATP